MSRAKKAAANEAAAAPRHASGLQKLLLAGAVGLELAWLATLVLLACL